jgi:hypothetical protein
MQQGIEAHSERDHTIESLYDMQFPSIEDAKAFLEENQIPLIWPSTRSDGHIMTNANGESVIVNGKEIPAIGKLTEKDRGAIRLTGLARGKIAYNDPNLSVQDLMDKNLTTVPEEVRVSAIPQKRGLVRSLLSGRKGAEVGAASANRGSVRRLLSGGSDSRQAA